MEEKRSILDYLAQVLLIFGFAMVMINLFCLAFGASAEEFSAMFSLGDKGIPVNVVFQFLTVSLLITALRFVFFTDTFIRKMTLWLRSLCLFTGIVIVISAFIIAFRWFPVGMWQSWAMFFACFGLSALGSYLVMNLKKKDENRRMEKALERLKAEEGNVNG
ncbi:MAG: hypothetical protein HFI25_10960 [Lachnospiraceae bacterium]|nr:hypothetical protein [Lachnospiraceae bacterium]